MKPTYPAELIEQIATKALGAASVTSRPTDTGVSTTVYRLDTDLGTFYLRISQDDPDEDNYESEVKIHELLRSRGVKVPEVVHVELNNEDLGHSFMIVREIPGRSVDDGFDPADIASILVAAGRDLAAINSTPVEGFGPVHAYREHPLTLVGANATYAEKAIPWFTSQLEEMVALGILDATQAKTLADHVRENSHLLEADQAYLNHHDFGADHVYHQGGTYTGIIDFGDAAGGLQLGDLGRFGFYKPDLLPHLLEGFSKLIPLPEGHERAIRFLGLVLNIGHIPYLTEHLMTSDAPSHRERIAVERGKQFVFDYLASLA